MSKTHAQSLFLVVTGMLVGGLAFQTLQSEAASPPSAPQPTPVAAQQPTPQVELPEPEPAAAFTVASESAKAFGHPATYGRFHIESASDVEARNVRLLIEPTSGNRIADVFGANWKRRGENAELILGDLSGGASKQVVVEFAGQDDSPVDLRVTYQDMSKETPTNTNLQIPATTLTAAFHSPDTEVMVQRELGERAIVEAEKLADERKFDDAIELIDDTRGRMGSAGMALRISGDLDRLVRELKELRADVKERSRPKPVVRKKADPGIEIIRGDRS